MKKTVIVATLILILAVVSCSPRTATKGDLNLKDAYEGKFLIGTALNERQIMGVDSASLDVVKRHFSAIVAENCMKSGPIHPQEDVYNFELPDKFVDFGTSNGITVTGHNLVWHSQAPRWFFVDDEGKDVSREVLIERMKNHIYTVVGRYKGRILGWDVVNEAVNDDGTLRNSKFLQIIGEDYLALAFQFAHEADPDAELYYNDYSMAIPAKRDGVVAMVKKIQEKGIRIDGIGMQCHVSLTSPDINEFERSLEAFAALGLKVMITEMDISVLPAPEGRMSANISDISEYRAKLNPYTEGLPDSVNVQFEDRTMEFFKLFLKHDDVVTRVTWWGVSDAMSWKNDFPMRGRTDYPLLFDRNNQAKSVIPKLIELAETYK